MAKAAKRPATYADLLQVPDDLIAELIDGELFTSPRPRDRHERAAGGIHARLRTFFDDGGVAGGWWISYEPELHLGGDVLVPDVCGWRRDRVPGFPIQGPAATIAPDWVCEVLSPRSGILDRTRKLPAYARYGVEFMWIVEPVHKTIEVFQLAGDHWTLLGVYGGDEPASIPPFESFEFPLATLWLPDTPPA